MQDNSKLVKSRLRELRKKMRLTQVDLANILGITVATYSRYEKGMFRLESGILCKVAEYYNVSVDYILMRTNDPRMYEDRSDSYIDFFLKYDNLNKDKKEILSAIIDVMMEKETKSEELVQCQTLSNE